MSLRRQDRRRRAAYAAARRHSWHRSVRTMRRWRSPAAPGASRNGPALSLPHASTIAPEQCGKSAKPAEKDGIVPAFSRAVIAALTCAETRLNQQSQSLSEELSEQGLPWGSHVGGVSRSPSRPKTIRPEGLSRATYQHLQQPYFEVRACVGYRARKGENAMA